MDAKTLREIHRKERMSPYLQDVGKDFYQQLKEYVDKVYLEYKACYKEGRISKLAVLLREFENIKTIINDIYETRERKIVSNALYYVKSGDEIETENLAAEEEETFRKIIEILRNQRELVLEKIVAEKALTELRVEKKPKLTVRILKDLPSIVGVDGRTYGAFKAEDVVTLPEPNAKVFINQGVAEQIDF